MLLLEPVCQLTIVTKEGEQKRLGDVIDPVQIDFILRCERQLEATGRIRQVVLKARQMGISTIIEAILFVLAIYNENLDALIVSHEKDSASHILRMTKRYWKRYPFAPLHDEEYNGRTNLSWSDLGSSIFVATAKNLEGGRSRTIRCLHASEVAFWPDGEQLMGGLSKTIPAVGLSAVFLESTANGIGNYFHSQWVAAKLGESEYEPTFYPWHAHPKYTIENLPGDVQAKYADLGKLDAEERRIKRIYKLSDGQLRWRRWSIANECNGSVDNFHQEYPCDPTEAFLSTGNNVFSLKNLIAHYEPRLGQRGKLVRSGNRVEFIPADDGFLTVYRAPAANQDWGMYRIGADPTHTQVNDFACAQVFHRRTMEQVAVLRMKDDPVAFAEQLYLLGQFYNWARIVPEKEGPGYATVGSLLSLKYPDVWRSVKLDQVPGKPIDGLHGWSTNVSTKPMAIGYMQHLLAQPLVQVGVNRYGLILHDEMTFSEMKDYVMVYASTGRTKYANAKGQEYDDGVMAACIAVATELIDADLPAFVDDYDPAQMAPLVARTRVQSGSGPTPEQIAALEQVTVGDGTARATPALAEVAAGDRPAPWESWED